MAEKPFVAVKSYRESPFILTDRKLSRVVEVAKNRLERIKVVGKYVEQHEVKFRNGKELRIDSLENVLELDNSKKNPISSLFMTFEVKANDNALHGVEILFNNSDLYHDRIWIHGESNDLSWLQETMGAIEEQVERVIPNDFVYSIKRKSGILSAIALVAFSISLLSVLAAITPRSGTLGLPQNSITELASLSASAKSETEKLDFIFRYLSMTLEKDKTSTPYRRALKNYRTYLTGIPVLFGVFVAIAGIFLFYPSGVFSWGDCGESYDTTVTRRKVLWYGVVLSLVIGVLGNLFVVGVTS